MRGRHWFFLLLISFAFLGGSFFFFAGAFLSLFSHQKHSGDVAVIEILGPIFDSKEICEEIRDLKDHREVKAVILRIDSPGGSVGASQEIHDAVKLLKTHKPVVASLGSVAASGGYYVATAANKIISNPGTLTGSIGVRMELLNAQKLFEWARLQPVTLKSGKFKDAGSSNRSMTGEEKKYFEGVLSQLHSQFKTAVSEDRGLTAEAVESLADGRVFTGLEAKEKGLVDELGSFDEAIHVASHLAGLKGDPELYYPSSRGEHFLESLLDGLVEKGVRHVAQVLSAPSY